MNHIDRNSPKTQDQSAQSCNDNEEDTPRWFPIGLAMFTTSVNKCRHDKNNRRGCAARVNYRAPDPLGDPYAHNQQHGPAKATNHDRQEANITPITSACRGQRIWMRECGQPKSRKLADERFHPSRAGKHINVTATNGTDQHYSASIWRYNESDTNNDNTPAMWIQYLKINHHSYY